MAGATASRRRFCALAAAGLMPGGAVWLAAPRPARAQAGAAAAASPPPEVAAALPAARLQGEARMRYLGFSVYDARLWVTTGFDPRDPYAHPFGLELRYARALRGPQIAERSLQEMRRLAPIADEAAGRWLGFMTGAFPDVTAGDRLTGLNLPTDTTRFLFNGAQPRELRDAEFARLFFGIWLSPQTSEPALRTRLLGGTA